MGYQSPQFSKDDVEVLEHNTVYQGYFRIDKYLIRHRLFSGGMSNVLTREVFERGNAVGVLLYDPILNKIILIEQLRIGVIHSATTPWLLEIVAGIVDKGETIEQVVRRETKEEAGLEVLDLMPICEYWVSPGGSTEKVALYLAKINAGQAGGVFGLDHEGEDIFVHVLDVEEAFKALEDGKIVNAITIITLQWFMLHREEIKKKWS